MAADTAGYAADAGGAVAGGERICAEARDLPSLASAARELRGTEGLPAVDSRRSERTPTVVRPDFIELSGLPAFGALSEAPAGSDAVVEVAAPDGTRLTIRVKGATSPNVAAWVSAFRGRP
jgi:hypothetical protein